MILSNLKFLLLLNVLNINCWANNYVNNTSLQITTDYGIIQGSKDPKYNNVYNFLNIPYTDPPERFEPPGKLTSWSPKILDGTKLGVQCPQPGSFGSNWSEDCLQLNIWTPTLDHDAKLPVMVYIHGGGFMTGSGIDDTFNGGYLASHGVLVVTLNYRLGIFGFFASTEFSQSDYPSIGTGLGFLDQIFAVKWIQENIHNFGGNPRHIVLFGESAGSLSTCTISLSPVSKKLWPYPLAGIILQSGPCNGPWGNYPTPMQALTTSAAFMAGFGINNIHAFRKIPAELIFNHPGFMAMLAPDGYVMPQSNIEAFKQGKLLNIPYIIGSTSRDGIFGPPWSVTTLYPHTQAQLYANLSLYGFTPTQIYTLMNLYDVNIYSKNITDTYVKMNGDVCIICPTVDFINTYVSKTDYPAWLYMYSYDGTNSTNEASHASELESVFHTPHSSLGRLFDMPYDENISKRMSGYWIEFAKKLSVSWKSSQQKTSKLSYLNINFLSTEEVGYRYNKCQFWNSLSLHVQSKFCQMNPLLYKEKEDK